MKAEEAVKVKFYCFLGIVNPTVYNTNLTKYRNTVQPYQTKQ